MIRSVSTILRVGLFSNWNCQLSKYTSENEIENKFKQYVNSPEGQKYWDEDMQGAQLPSIEGTKSTPDTGSKSGTLMGGQTKPDIIDFILDDIFS